jgi:hypothetical protein
MRRRTYSKAGLALGGALSAALGLSALVASTPAGASTQHRITVAKSGFSLILPNGWNQVSLNPADIGAVLGKGTAYGNLKSELTSQATSAAAKGLKFFAVSPPGAAGDFVPDINVGIFKGSGSLASLDSEIKIIWAQAGAKNLVTKTVHIAPGAAVEGTYELVAKSTNAIVWETQVYVPHKGQVYISTFSAGSKPAVELTAAAVMKTFRFTH